MLGRNGRRAVSDYTLDGWARAKSLGRQLAADLAPQAPELAEQLYCCQDWMTFRWTEDGHPSIWKTSRCRKHRICPVCRLARQRRLAPAIDLFSRELVGDEIFFSLMGRGTLSQHVAAWKHCRDSQAYRQHVAGAFVGRHVRTPPLVHQHGILEHDGDFPPERLDALWRRSALKAGISHAYVDVGDVRSPAASITYSMRPFSLFGVDPSELLAMDSVFALGRQGRRSYTFSGEFAGYWLEALAEAERTRLGWKDSSSALAYEWEDPRAGYRKSF